MCLLERHALFFRYDGKKFLLLQLLNMNINEIDILLCAPLSLTSQELASVSAEGRSGDLSVLGNVKHKMVCSPDFESLLEARAL